MAFDAYLRQQFPGVRITSGYRDPNSPLGRANPRSWHNQGKAWDVAPIDGVSYNEYIDRIGKDYEILEARDEVTNPSKHATGPHWHAAVGARKEQPRVNNLASLMQGIAPLARQEEQQPQGLAALLQQGQQPLVPQQQAMQQPNIPSLPAISPKEKRPVWKDILGSVLDTIAVAGGQKAGYWPGIQQDQERDDKAREKLAEMIALQKQKQAERAAAMEDWKAREDYQRENPQPTQMTETERLIEAAATLPDSDPRKAMIQRALRGSAYDPALYQPKEDYVVAGRKAVKTTVPGKAPSSGGSGGGARPMTATARAKYISEAQAALARGADPAKVKARLVEIGVQ